MGLGGGRPPGPPIAESTTALRRLLSTLITLPRLPSTNCDANNPLETFSAFAQVCGVQIHC